MTVIESHREHGTHVKFVIDKCRCDDCRRANTAYERKRRARIEPAYVSATPSRRHIEGLRAAGVGLKTIAKRSGVSHGALSKLMYGTTTRRPSKRIRRETEAKILALTAADAADRAKIDAAPTWVLLDEMIAAGAPKSAIALALGTKGPGLQLGRDEVTASNARKVAELHAAWCAGTVMLERRDSHGNVYVAAPPKRVPREAADISDLLLDLAEIVEARNAEPWRADAACRSRPAYLWFPARGDRETMNAGLSICRACIVRPQCRAANLDRTEGTYGGLTASARRDLRRSEAAT